MKTFTPFEYLLIDCANHYGLDKQVFEARILWAKTNLHRLSEIDPSEADEPEQFTKAVQTIQNVINGQSSGHIVRLDAICSG